MGIINCLAPGDARQFLAGAVLFQDFAESELNRLIDRVDWLFIPGGEILFNRGDPADSAYFVVSGRLEVVLQRADGEIRLLREVAVGENVGEAGMLAGSQRSATVRAARDTVLARVNSETFAEIIRSNPQAMLRLMRMLAGWLAQSNEMGLRDQRVKTIAVLVLASEPRELGCLNEFASALCSFGTVARVSEADMDSRFGQGAAGAEDASAAGRAITDWLNQQERAHCSLVLETSDRNDIWSKRCIRHADRIVVFADARARPEVMAEPLRRIESVLSGREATLHLCLVHPPSTIAPKATSPWLSQRQFAAHHHVRAGAAIDFARSTRNICGKSVGLVLGGGAARAYAHIGVLRAMEELQIPIDRIGGTSAGAVIAAHYALGWNWKEILDFHQANWFRRRPLKDYTLPLISVVSGRGAAFVLRKAFGQARLEDFWLPFFCMSTNLTRSTAVVHTTGSAFRSLWASAAIPGIFPPGVSDEGDILVDGGVMNNLPADVMRQQGARVIVGVDVSPAYDACIHQYQRAPGALRSLMDRFRRPREARFPGIVEILQRAAVVSSVELSRRVSQQMDIALAPPVEGFGIFQFDKIDQIAEVGYRYAMEALKGRAPLGVERVKSS
jgi:predicted acylesterase/phospholipase RssA/CRP-like cAMP-binding protein